MSLGSDARAEPEDKGRWSGIPIIAFAPETSLLLGGAAIYTFRIGEGNTDARRSNAVFTAAYSLKNQFIFGLASTLYLGGETWRLRGGMSGVWFPNTLYAAGPDSPEDSAEGFTDRAFGFEGGATRLIAGSFRVGAVSLVGHSTITKVEPGGLIDSGELGADGGRIVGVGPTVAWDDRDNDNSPTRGGEYRATALFFPGAAGDYDFSLYTVEARRYLTITTGHVVAAELYGKFSAGEVPFQSMPGLGGAQRMRGFFKGRFRDKHLIAAQIEYRFPVWRRFGAAAFAGVGDVAPALDKFALRSLEVAGGAGLRYALSPKDRVNLRLDFGATSEGNTNMYISLGEAF